MDTQPTGPLRDLRILDVTHAAAGPYAAMLLADFGAEVIKIEPPDGEFVRHARPRLDHGEGEGEGDGPYGGRFAARNRNKLSVALDLNDDRDRNTFLDLAATADGLVENMRAGVLDRLGVGWDVLRQRNPRLVYAAIRGFGDPRTGRSPYADWPAFDVIAQAMGGLVAMTGPDREHPMRAGPIIGDLVPAMLAALGLVSAIHHARESGEGQFLDVAMVDAVMALCTQAQTMWDYEGRRYEPSGSATADVVPFDIYRTVDGHCAIAAPRDDHWQTLCALMGRADLLDDDGLATGADRLARRDLVDQVVSDWAGGHTTAELLTLLGGRVPVGPVMGPPEWADDPHVRARQMLVSVDHPHHRPTVEVACPVKFTATPANVYRPPPSLDEHRAAILRELTT
ncbi:MAG: CoA transferase [Acidimicrobiia bacterium]|nr:CoA transferase [Acidimicrobiia bacterium]